MSEPAPIDLPPGLWSQPAPDSSGVDGLADVEAVQMVRTPATLHYDYTPGIATTRFLRAIKDKTPDGGALPRERQGLHPAPRRVADVGSPDDRAGRAGPRRHHGRLLRREPGLHRQRAGDPLRLRV